METAKFADVGCSIQKFVPTLTDKEKNFLSVMGDDSVTLNLLVKPSYYIPKNKCISHSLVQVEIWDDAVASETQVGISRAHNFRNLLFNAS